MAITIENLTDRPVLLVLSSGESLRLSPGATSVELHEVEIQNNPKVDKLVKQRVIAVSVGKTEQTPVNVGQPAAAEGAVTTGETAEGKVTSPPSKKPKSSAQQ